ncbi:hypothetical protein P9477_23590 [Enterobacter mori]|uniref:hypothetical protein n=1 Tax=Enterobacter mori TaxID=539813 RepID=UPI00398B68E3
MTTTKLTAGALNGRFNNFTGKEVIEAIAKEDQRLRADVMTTLAASDAFAGKVKAIDFKRSYIAHVVFGSKGVEALEEAQNIATKKGFDVEEGVKFLDRVCSLPSWRTGARKAAENKDYSLLISKIQLEEFVADDHEAEHPTFSNLIASESEPAAPEATVKDVITLLYSAWEGQVKGLREAKRNAITAIRDEITAGLEAGTFQATENRTLLKTTLETFNAKAEEVKNPPKQAASTKATDTTELDNQLMAEFKAKSEQEAPGLVARILEAVKNSEDENQATIYNVSCEAFAGLTHYYRNRDFVEHGKKKHTQGEITSEQQRNVSVAVLDKVKDKELWEAEEEYIKRTGCPNTLPVIILDGHTRSYNRSQYKGGKPVMEHCKLVVRIHHNLNAVQIHKEFLVYCGKDQAMDNKDKASSGNKTNMLELKSGFAKSYWANSFKLCDNWSFYFGEDMPKRSDTLEIETIGKGAASDVFEWIDTLGIETTRDNSVWISPGVRSGLLDSFAICKKEGIDTQVAKDFWSDFYRPITEENGERQIVQVLTLAKYILDKQKARGNDNDILRNKKCRDLFADYLKAVKKSGKTKAA